MDVLQHRAELKMSLVRQIKRNFSNYLLVTSSISYDYSAENSDIALKYVAKQSHTVNLSSDAKSISPR
jgi:hypothetical protein